MPSFYPLVNDASYDTQKSFRIDVFSPSNTTTSNINLKVFFLVITSDFALDRHHSVNVTNSRDLDLGRGGLYSTDFDGGMQMKIRQSTKSLIVLEVRNIDSRPYLAERIVNFTLELRNYTQ